MRALARFNITEHVSTYLPCCLSHILASFLVSPGSNVPFQSRGVRDTADLLRQVSHSGIRLELLLLAQQRTNVTL